MGRQGEPRESGGPRNLIQVVFDLFATISQLIDDMAAAVTAERGFPLSEVLGWTWSRLRQQYDQVARRQWDAYLSQVSAVETGVARVLGPAFGGKPPKALPDYETTHPDPFAEPQGKAMDSEFWRKYREANKLD